ncbi:MAG: TraE/TraK family type IV conjugative transfer system protein, partial [Duodenibacillus sp.]
MACAFYQKITADAAAMLKVRAGLLWLTAASVTVNVALAGVLLFKTDTSCTVVIAPDAGGPYIAMNDKVSANLLERFSVSALHLALNLSPSNARWQMEAFLKHVSPENHAAIAQQFETGVRELERNHAASVFYAHGAQVDADRGVVCLAGERRLMIAKTVTESVPMTACLATTVRMGRLWIVQLRFEEGALAGKETKTLEH